MRHSWLLFLPLAASLAPVDQIKTLLKLGRIDGATGYHELDSGFCNSVYRVDTHKKPVVVKIYSAMAKARCAPACRGVVDEAVGAAGLGPQIHVRTDDALVAEFVDGETLTERDLKDEATALAIAPKLAQLHALPIPEPLPHEPAALWIGIDAMLACDGDALDASLLRREAARMRDAVEACTHADVLGHGDLKPSNVLRLRRGGVTFIDFELARPLRRRGRLRRLRNRADGVVDAIRFSLARRPVRTTAATTSSSSFARQNCRRRRTRLSCPSSRPTLVTARRSAPPTRASWKRSSSSRSRGSRRRYSSPSPRRRSRRSARKWRPSRGTGGALTRTAPGPDLMPLYVG